MASNLKSAESSTATMLVAQTNRQLAQVWIDFESGLTMVPLISRLQRGKLRLEDYQAWLINLRQQVIEGSRWIARAASHIRPDYGDLQSLFTRHAATEHQDYHLLEQDYVATGGNLETIRCAEKNIGSEALSAWMYHAASRENPFGLLGAMFIIEGLGQRLARPWAEAIQAQLGLGDDAVRFLKYHAANDDDHFEVFDTALRLVVTTEKVSHDIVRHARVTARLYRLQLEEIGHV
jgi:pyrroloquinoline quinone (PQQ) biosynthesis protein C